jgi:hypothetical protein
MSDYTQKYLKYKEKYLRLKNIQNGGKFYEECRNPKSETNPHGIMSKLDGNMESIDECNKRRWNEETSQIRTGSIKTSEEANKDRQQNAIANRNTHKFIQRDSHNINKLGRLNSETQKNATHISNYNINKELIKTGVSVADKMKHFDNTKLLQPSFDSPKLPFRMPKKSLNPHQFK